MTSASTPKIKQIHPDIPLSRAWQIGRRLYVRCAYQSTLNGQLRDLGARWDGEQRALWTGSGKRDRVVELVLAAEERRRQVELIKAAGHWVKVPYDATQLRELAKKRGGIWDEERKVWAMPDEQAQAQLSGEVAAWEAALAARMAELQRQRQREDAEAEAVEQQAQQEAAEQRRLRIIAASGRTPTGETESLREISTRYMNKATARQMARELGSLVRLRDGRRGIVTGVTIWFTGEELASSVCWHAETHDEAHWDFDYTVEIVEVTAAEVERDAAAEAEAADSREIHALMREAARLTEARTVEPATPTPTEPIGMIRCEAGTPGTTNFNNGTLTLTVDGQVVWKHPGYYDDYRPTEGISVDPGLVERVQAVLDRGDRTREVIDQLVYVYTVTLGSG